MSNGARGKWCSRSRYVRILVVDVISKARRVYNGKSDADAIFFELCDVGEKSADVVNTRILRCTYRQWQA